MIMQQVSRKTGAENYFLGWSWGSDPGTLRVIRIEDIMTLAMTQIFPDVRSINEFIVTENLPIQTLNVQDELILRGKRMDADARRILSGLTPVQNMNQYPRSITIWHHLEQQRRLQQLQLPLFIDCDDDDDIPWPFKWPKRDSTVSNDLIILSSAIK